MRTKIIHTALAWLALSTLICQTSTAFAQGTAFTYQGRLNDGGSPANGSYDFRFKLYGNPLTKIPVGNFVTNAIPTTNGLFTVVLDFGPGILTGANYWLEVSVRTNNTDGAGSYTVLNPVQAITPAPYAVFANTASNILGTLPASQVSGSISLAQLPSGLVTNNAPQLTVNGSITAAGFNAVNNADLSLQGSSGSGAGAGGNVNINSGLGGTTGSGGSINLVANASGSITSGSGGNVNLNAGTGGNGGVVSLTGGASGGGTFSGGNVAITGGNGGASGNGGVISLIGGSGSNGGNVNIAGGVSANNSAGGNITVNSGGNSQFNTTSPDIS